LNRGLLAATFGPEIRSYAAQTGIDVKLVRLGPLGQERPALLDEGVYFDLSPFTSDFDAVFFRSGGIDRLREAIARRSLEPVRNASKLRVAAPIAKPGAVIGIGTNYAGHAAESGSPPPGDVVMFLKAPNTVSGPYDPIWIPMGSSKTDWEVELGVVIGREASRLASPVESIAHVAGFVTVNDVSEREFQLEASGGQWSKGKCFPGFAPTGPWLATPDEVNYRDVRLRSWVNGEPRQDARTGDMVFGVDDLIWRLSQFLTLEPGDLVLTGTPQGVALSGRFPFLAPGDVVEVEVDGLGRQRTAMNSEVPS